MSKNLIELNDKDDFSVSCDSKGFDIMHDSIHPYSLHLSTEQVEAVVELYNKSNKET